MKKVLFLLLSVIFLAIGLVGMLAFQGSVAEIIEGGAKGLAGVFFILFYIFLLMGEGTSEKKASH